ncbi:MFS transporter [Agrilactobacillus composti]|uniref:MFS transporter n=1 Tax=Agrilactobacillus composti TaxID=398555 RepID=UPI0030842502
MTLLAAIASTIIYGVVQASSKGSFNNPQALIYIGIGLALLLVYSAYAHRHETTVVLPLNLFRHKNFTGSMLGLLLAGFITSGPMILLPLFFQDVRGQSVILAAIALIPQSIGMLISRGSIGRLVDKIGARWVVIASIFVTILGTAPFIYFDQHSSYLLIALVLFIRGIGGAGIVQPLMSDPFIGLAKSQTAQASIGTRMMQQVGGGFGSAFLATIVASYTANHHVTTTLGLTSAYQQAFLWSTVLIIVILIPAMLLTNKMKLEIRELN